MSKHWTNFVSMRVSAKKKSELLALALTLALFYVGPAGHDPATP